MKRVNLIVLVISIFTVLSCSAQNPEIEKIETTIIEFSKAGDKNDSKKLEAYLDDNYRIVMNRLFGAESVSVMDKTTYLEKIKSKEYGGDKRELNIENVVINGTTASSKVTFKNSKTTFISIIVLIQNTEGAWKIVSDVPIVK